jgi:hypothetical protein
MVNQQLNRLHVATQLENRPKGCMNSGSTYKSGISREELQDLSAS